MKDFVCIEERKKRFYEVLSQVRKLAENSKFGNVTVDFQVPAPRKNQLSGYVVMRIDSCFEIVGESLELLAEIIKEKKSGFRKSYGSKVTCAIKHEKDYTSLMFCIPDVWIIDDVESPTESDIADALGLTSDELHATLNDFIKGKTQ